MIIKSMGRKKSTGKKNQSIYATLINYMLDEKGAQIDLENNMPYATDRYEVIDLFEDNGRYMHERKGANQAYHEIISLPSRNIDRDQMKQQLREIGRMYIDKRARDNLAIGVIHEEKDHLHLHLMISANKIYERNRHRLSKDDFLKIQNEVSREAQQKYPELALDNLYRAENVKSPLKEQVRLTKDEQERAVRTDKEPSQKVKLAAKIHTLLAQHQDQKSLDQALQSQGLSLYQRGKTLGVIDQDGKRHRLSTLGVEPHYQQWQEQQRTVDQARNNPITPEKQPKQDPSILKDIVTRAQERISDLLQSEKTTEQRAAADRIKTHGQQNIDTLRRAEAIQQRSEQRLDAMNRQAPEPPVQANPQPSVDAMKSQAQQRMAELQAAENRRIQQERADKLKAAAEQRLEAMGKQAPETPVQPTHKLPTDAMKAQAQQRMAELQATEDRRIQQERADRLRTEAQKRMADMARNSAEPVKPAPTPQPPTDAIKAQAQQRMAELQAAENRRIQQERADKLKAAAEQRLEAMRQATTAPQPAKAPDPQPRRDIQAEALRRMQEISANQQTPSAPNRSTPPPTPAAKPSPSPQTSSLAQQMIDERRQRESAVKPPQTPPARDAVADRVTQLKQARDKGKDLERDAER
jgi:hypothetical protein